jgi:NADPH:quinone reductase-like Zn-dependent oxidoreductase
MKAAIYTEYGSPDVLRIEEAKKPVPKDNEILIKIHAVSINFGDLLARNMKTVTPGKFSMPLPLWLLTRIAFGFNKPRIKILGSEFAGEIEAVGKNVRRFKEGEQVFGYLGPSMGANAEYMCMRESKLVAVKPTNLSYEEAAAIPYGALTALNLLRKVKIRSGDKVLINGASGGIGSAAVQLAKYYGAEVTGVCGTPRLELVKSLGADHVIDYTKEDFTQNGETYNLIVDILGKRTFSRCQNALKPKGCYLLASFKTGQLWQMMLTKMKGDKRVLCALSTEGLNDLLFVKGLIEAGRIKSVIDRCFPLEAIAEAHRYVESGAKKGNVVITMGNR